MSWTDEKIAVLKGMHADGASFREIGNKIGMSRSACIGKAHRLNLASRESTNKSAAPKPRKLRPPRVRYILGQIRSQPKPPSQLMELPEEISKNPVSFAGLQENHCRWPVSGEERPIMFCGDPQFNRSFCFHHFRMGYVAPRRYTESSQEFVTNRLTRSDKPVEAPPLQPQEMVA